MPITPGQKVKVKDTFPHKQDGGPYEDRHPDCPPVLWLGHEGTTALFRGYLGDGFRGEHPVPALVSSTLFPGSPTEGVTLVLELTAQKRVEEELRWMAKLLAAGPGAANGLMTSGRWHVAPDAQRITATINSAPLTVSWYSGETFWRPIPFFTIPSRSSATKGAVCEVTRTLLRS